MVPIRLQHLQVGGGLAAGLCCLALGAMSLLVNLDDYVHIRNGAEVFKRFEHAGEAINAVATERVPVGLLIVNGSIGRGAVEAVRRSRQDTDRLLAFVEDHAIDGAPDAPELRRILDDVRARLTSGRRLVDGIVAAAPDARQGQDFRPAMEEMFAASATAETLRDRLAQEVIAVAPGATTEVFLNASVGALRDQAGRLGTYVLMMLREPRRDPDTIAKFYMTAGRLSASVRVLKALAHAFPANDHVALQFAAVERAYFQTAFPIALGAPTRPAATDDGIEFAALYVRGLAAIDGLRDSIVLSSQGHLRRSADVAFQRAMFAGLLTALVCLILFGTIVVFRRSLFAPLGRAREQAIAIARGDLSSPVFDPTIGGEVGDMLAGLDAIRGEQIWRRQFEEQQAEMARQLKRLSETDMLTGLLNRRALDELAGRLFGGADWVGERIGVILFDIDNFKSINDTFGHATGDNVLRSIACEIGLLLRPQDVFVRLGGEEFLILLPGVAEDEAGAIAARLCESLPQVVWISDEGSPVTASFGLAVREAGSGLGLEALVAIADRRLYVAKRTGRNRVCDRDPESVAMRVA